MTDYGLFTIAQEDRVARGYLLPWGKPSRGISASGTPQTTFPRGSVTLPKDPMVVSLNDEHARFGVIGRATVLEDRAEGIYAEFALAKTDEADDWLADHEDKAYFSAEVDQLVIRAGKGRGVLGGAAVTGTPAFPGTGLFSLAQDEDDVTYEDGDDDTDDTDDADADSADDNNDAADAGADDAASTATEGNGDNMPEGTNTMLASRRQPTKPKAAARLTSAGFFAAWREARRVGSIDPLVRFKEDAEKVGLFALADVAYDGTGGLAEDAGIPGAWLGQLWQGRRYQRRIIPLLSQGTLTSMKATGWIWGTKPAMSTWDGNKADVPTNTPTVTPKEFAAQRFAGGHDLAREYYDFNVTEVIDAYAVAMVDSYAKQSDTYARTQLVAGATAFTPDAATENKGLSGIIDGALAVVDADATPSFALVAKDVYKDVMKTPHSDALEYFSAVVGLEDGDAAGFRIQPDGGLAAGTVMVGAKEAATAWELPASPIRVSLPDLVKGGVDEAFFGYCAVGVTAPAALVSGTVTFA